MKVVLMMILIYSQGNYAEESAAVRLQSFERDGDPEASAQDASQYAAVYQALDPKSLDWAGVFLPSDNLSLFFVF